MKKDIVLLEEYLGPDWKGFNLGFLIPYLPFFNGEHQDITTLWYFDVGQYITMATVG